MKPVTPIILAIALAMTSSPDVVTAQSVCQGVARVLAAGLEDSPPFSSLKLYSLPSADCAIERRGRRFRFVCFWPYSDQDMGIWDRKAQAKRFAGSINECIENQSLPVTRWQEWKDSQRGGRWKIKDVDYLFEIQVYDTHKGLMDDYEGDSTDGLLLRIKRVNISN